MSDIQDRWIGGELYEDFMGRWSRQLAPRFVSWLQVPAGGHWLDVGCGTGALTDAVCIHAYPASVLGCDPSTQFIEYARRYIRHKQAAFIVAQANSLPMRKNGYDCVSSLLALNFFPDYPASVQEMMRLVRPGGIVSACVWDYAGKMEFLRFFWDIVVSLNPGARTQDEGIRFPICNRDALTKLFVSTGLIDVKCEAIDLPTSFKNFADYWGPMLAGTGPAAAYVASIDEARRNALASVLQHKLPQTESGEIHLVARSWAVRGTVR